MKVFEPGSKVKILPGEATVQSVRINMGGAVWYFLGWWSSGNTWVEDDLPASEVSPMEATTTKTIGFYK